METSKTSREAFVKQTRAVGVKRKTKVLETGRKSTRERDRQREI